MRCGRGEDIVGGRCGRGGSSGDIVGESIVRCGRGEDIVMGEMWERWN